MATFSGEKWCDLQSATLECKCNETERVNYERLMQMLREYPSDENHYKAKPRIDIPSQKDISDQIYKLLSFHNQDLSEFEVSVMAYSNPVDNTLRLTILLTNYAYQTKNEASTIFFGYEPPEEVRALISENLNALVQKYLSGIKMRNKINIKKENDIMMQYNTCEKFAVTKTQEEIEFEEKLAKLRAEYDKKAAKLREEFKAAKEKKERDTKAKELHDKYQSLIDAGFSTEQAYDILRTKMNTDEF